MLEDKKRYQDLYAKNRSVQVITRMERMAGTGRWGEKKKHPVATGGSVRRMPCIGRIKHVLWEALQNVK